MEKFTRSVKCIVSGVACVVCLVMNGGCLSSSPAPRYYTLDMTASGAERSSPYSVLVERLETAGPLDRRNILIKTSETEAASYARDQWLTELGELDRDKLNGELNGGDEKPALIAISGKILCFEQVDMPDGTAEAHIRLQLAFYDAKDGTYGEPFCTRIYDVSEKAGDASASSVVRSLSRGLERISGKIKDTLAAKMDAENG
jgi:ABC-type uncharacterized transport system auxiliary subunit